jgi:hypothetical protein
MVRRGLLWLVSLAVLHAQDALIIGERGFRVKQGVRIVTDTSLRCRTSPSLDSVSGWLEFGEPVNPGVPGRRDSGRQGEVVPESNTADAGFTARPRFCGTPVTANPWHSRFWID